MKKRWALLTILASLLLGIACTTWVYGGVSRAMRTVFGCEFLAEAEKAGYIDKAKRSALVDALANDGAHNPSERASIATMKDGCFNKP
jgi:hypothetical protein